MRNSKSKINLSLENSNLKKELKDYKKQIKTLQNILYGCKDIQSKMTGIQMFPADKFDTYYVTEIYDNGKENNYKMCKCGIKKSNESFMNFL